TGGATIILREPLVRHVHLGEPEHIAAQIAAAVVCRRTRHGSQPFNVTRRKRLSGGGGRILTALGGGSPVGGETRNALLPFPPSLGTKTAPPRVTPRVCVLTPALLDLVAVTRVIESLE